MIKLMLIMDLIAFIALIIYCAWNEFDTPDYPHWFFAWVIGLLSLYRWYFIFAAIIAIFLVEQFRRRKIPKGTIVPSIFKFVTPEFISGDEITLTFEQFLNYYNLAPSKYSVESFNYVAYRGRNYKEIKICFQTLNDVRAYRKWVRTREKERQVKWYNDKYKEYLESVQKDIDRYREDYLHAN